MVRFDVIYEPRGPAKEYSAWACNIVKSGQRGDGPKSCSHGCLYCYNPPGNTDSPILKDNIIQRLKSDLSKLKGIIKPGERLEFTFVGDLYDPKIPAGVARDCLLACKQAEIPFQVLTKNGILAKNDFDLYGPDDLFGVTLTCDNDRDSLRWEPGASLWSDRIAALKLAKERKIATWVSFEPVVEPEQTLHLIELVKDYADKIKVGKLNTKNNQPWHCEEIKAKSSTISWEAFGKSAVELLEKLGKNYYIKADLAPFVSQHVPASISEVFNKPDIFFVFLRSGIKFPPIEEEWEKKEHTFEEAKSTLGNVGVLAGRGYIGFDLDVPEAFDGLELPLSTSWETRPGRKAMRFRCVDRTAKLLASYGKKPDQAQIKLYKNGQSVGEVKLERTYQVIPPSWKKLENGLIADYKMINEIEASEISLEKLLADLKKIGITFSKNEVLEENAKKLENIGKAAKIKNIETDEKRARRYAEAALEKEVQKVRAAIKGDRNDQLYRSSAALGEFVGAGILSIQEVDSALSRVARDDEPEKIPKTIMGGIEKGSKNPRKIPKLDEKQSLADALLLGMDLKNAEKLKADPGLPFKSKYVSALAIIKKEDRAEFERIQIAIKKNGTSIRDLKKIIDEQEKKIRREEIPEPTAPKTPKNIHDSALDTLKNGNPVQKIANCCGRMVLGADKAFKKLVCCMAVQDVAQSAGLHPKLNGESGGGKTWIILTFAHHLPREMVIKGSMSNKAGFYHKDGNRVLRILDDYQAGNEDLDTVIKQTSSTFHEEYEHRTVVNQEPVTLTIGSEQTWAITSVDSSQDVQVLNRQIPINVNDSECLTKEVNQKTVERYGKGESQFPESDNVEICREIWRILRADGLINVRIPYWNRIDWIDTSNRRNPSIFMDLLVAHTSMMRYQREKDEDGFYLAKEEDFQAAKDLFTDKDAEELVKRLTRREREFAECLLKSPSGLTRGQVAEILKVSVNRITQLANGEAGKGGLAQKLPGFEIDEITDTMRLDDDGRSRSVRKTVYSLRGYNQFEGFDGVVRLSDEPIPRDDNKHDKDGVRDGVRTDESKKTDRSRGGVESIERESKYSKVSEKQEKIKSSSNPEEKDELSKELDSNKLSQNISFSHLHQKPYMEGKTTSEDPKDDLTPTGDKPYQPYTEPTDIEKETLSPGKIDRETPVSDATRIKLAARLEYGINALVDARVVAGKLSLPVGDVVAWLDVNYEKVREFVYTQKRHCQP